MNNSTVIKKKLNLGMGYLCGGTPTVYARNVIRGGDWASVCFLYGLIGGKIEDNSKILISMNREFNNHSNLEQVKNFLKSINSSIEFANDCPTGNFLDPQKVLDEASKQFKLMDFEKTAIIENREMLHRLYVSALKNNKQDTLPSEFKYYLENGSLYPFLGAYRAVCALLP